ncbi:unnamed protein product [Spirodela intermedia]|uniref:CCHC-type domain-containing protein n=1 Tax=Spirodela intermedia TaxID=51605 RepID=A0A7I8LAW1_SPIIN|nr:unnamed protein product [Spirodela intermedia]
MGRVRQACSWYKVHISETVVSFSFLILILQCNKNAQVCYRCEESGHKSNICPKRGDTVSIVDSIEEEKKHEESEIEGEVPENFIEFDTGDAVSHSLVVRRLIGSSENIVSFDTESLDSEADFFSKIGALRIQAHLLFLF